MRGGRLGGRGARRERSERAKGRERAQIEIKVERMGGRGTEPASAGWDLGSFLLELVAARQRLVRSRRRAEEVRRHLPDAAEAAATRRGRRGAGVDRDADHTRGPVAARDLLGVEDAGEARLAVASEWVVVSGSAEIVEADAVRRREHVGHGREVHHPRRLPPRAGGLQKRHQKLREQEGAEMVYAQLADGPQTRFSEEGIDLKSQSNDLSFKSVGCSLNRTVCG